MIDFEKIDQMIDYVEKGSVPTGYTFNEFVREFYEATKSLPLSKYLRSKNLTSKLPKIMNSKKAGEVIYFSEKDSEVKTYLKRKGFTSIPELNYTCIMLLRKVELYDNWKKLISYFEGEGTIEEINRSTKPNLLPAEKEKLEGYVMDALDLTENEYSWFMDKFSEILKEKKLLCSLKKLAKN